jgi:protein-S-isoprenylcysteine O-methyltransferase Ste14
MGTSSRALRARERAVQISCRSGADLVQQRFDTERGRPYVPVMSWLHIDYGLWLVIIGVWLAAAPFAKKTVRRETLGMRGRYVGAAILVVVTAQIGLRIPALASRIVPDAAWAGVLSVLLTASGIAFALWARFTLGRNWSGTVTVKEGHELVRRGPYALVRHPIYTGVALAILGTSLAIGSARAVFIVVPLVLVMRFKMRNEEEMMAGEFGEEYAEYRKRVKGLVPFVW